MDSFQGCASGSISHATWRVVWSVSSWSIWVAA
jgi:hypothetical protein